ncbi:TRAP transporter large permease [Alcaligenes ammonioxydans]|jgi:C4-dicarboxylate transporter DctM subunit|uniref:TRAP transporter large permease protein n=1 Tax=Alcaligenes ammonioxydans TaxID=2582914 RepID=A0ABX8SNI4_9BURK|nr:TRAP transporter large permease [Alcaligenes ammonioxydans]EJC65112.1 TRAP-type C4-dicarboxylate transport system, large permease component [Alcaligenes faecalis subsp. faecalis NCIB 8687]QBH19587.1 TRAP transporter large permease [Alcaligenes faecalis]MCH1880017.1 TRAP transporter large permease [Alcaligenes ammonioxydans]QXX77596.1 TRAP transporter large permease [Alcaligenes ammonioxydans]WGQ35642.1 TRAP transporter large permease [Alcaligenes faecalis]
MLISIIGLLVLLGSLFLGLPIAWGMLLVGTLGFAFFTGMEAALIMAAQTSYDTAMSYSFTVLPLFILMGNLVNASGLSKDLYKAAHAFIGHLRGGLAMATIVACGAFSALCGSSMATTAAMGRVAMPNMRKYNYDDRLATGSIAAGGTLGILIPPSVMMVVYGILTETDIGKLFAAGFLPGMVAMLMYLITVMIITAINPSLGRPGEKASWRERFEATKGVMAITVLFIVIMGGIYGGVFTPTEAAGIGAAATFLLTLKRRGWQPRMYLTVLIEAAQTTAIMFALVIGALVFTNFLSVAGLPNQLLSFIEGIDVSPIMVILIICAIYLVLGCFLETMSMVMLTVPIFYPIVASLGFDLVWFGVIVVVAAEISLITPPLGLNIFMIKNVMPDVPLGTIIRGVAPFVMMDILRLLLLVFVPWIVLVIPNSM